MSENEQKAGCVDLLPCPFCAAQPNWCMCNDEGGCHRIECACGLQLDTLAEEAKATETIPELRAIMAKSWNRRAALEAAALSPARSGEAVQRWIAERAEYRKRVAAYNARVAYAREHELGRVSVDHEYQAMTAQERIVRDWAETAAMELERAPRNESSGVSPGGGWIRVADKLPEFGQRIEGRNERGQTWEEEFDPGEPLGLMTHWRPRTPASEKKHGTPAPQDSVRVGDGEWIAKLKRELMMSKMTHAFTFSRDEVIELLGGMAALTTPAPAAGADGEKVARLRMLVEDLPNLSDEERETALVSFFRSPTGAAMGRHGDAMGWTPEQTAQHFLSDGAGQSAGGGDNG